MLLDHQNFRTNWAHLTNLYFCVILVLLCLVTSHVPQNDSDVHRICRRTWQTQTNLYFSTSCNSCSFISLPQRSSITPSEQFSQQPPRLMLFTSCQNLMKVNLFFEHIHRTFIHHTFWPGGREGSGRCVKWHSPTLNLNFHHFYSQTCWNYSLCILLTNPLTDAGLVDIAPPGKNSLQIDFQNIIDFNLLAAYYQSSILFSGDNLSAYTEHVAKCLLYVSVGHIFITLKTCLSWHI